MKFFKYSILAVAATLGVAFSACSDDDDDYVPGPQSNGAFFTTANSSRVTLDTDASELSLVVGRVGDTAEADVKINVTTDLPEGLFNFPSTVHFAQGETQALYVATCDLPEEDTDRKYTLTVAIDPTQPICNYGDAELNIALTLRRKVEKFNHYGVALLYDGWMAGIYNFNMTDGSQVNGVEIPWYVNLNQSEENPDVYQLEDCFTCEWALVQYTGVDANAGQGEPTNIRIDATNPLCVKIEPQFTGCYLEIDVFDDFAEKVSPVYICNYAGFYASRGNSDEAIINNGFGQEFVEDGTTLEIDPAILVNPKYMEGQTVDKPITAFNSSIIVFYPGEELDEEGEIKSVQRRADIKARYNVKQMKRALGFRSL